ncbi:MAG: Scr1 family TA system antitoxin-like transcriptional regulator [Pseudonocardiaceae bacterium]
MGRRSDAASAAPLTGPHSLRFHAVLCEAALRLEVGGPAVMTAQLDLLLAAATSENVTIQVLPASHSQHAGIASNFTVLHFADPEIDPPLGYFDGPLGGYIISDPGDVASMVTMFDDLSEPALDASASAALLAGILAEYWRKGDTPRRDGRLRLHQGNQGWRVRLPHLS